MTFEESYPRQSFSELVRLALVAGKFLVGAKVRFEAAWERFRAGLAHRETPAA